MAAAVPEGELACVREDLGRLQRQIEAVEEKINHAFAECMKEGGPSTESGKMWMERERQLREEKKLLLEKEKQLREKENLLLEKESEKEKQLREKENLLLEKEKVQLELLLEERRKAAAQPAPVAEQTGPGEGILARIAQLEAAKVQLETTTAAHEVTLQKLNASSVPASEINDLSLKRVLEEQRVIIHPASASPSWEDVLSTPIPQPPPFKWEEGRSELWHKESYITEIQSWLPDYLEAVDVSAQSKELPGASIKLTGKNDVLVVPRSLRSHKFEWAVLGIELKVPKYFTEQALRQARAEFLLFASRSMLPFVQVVTDLNRGAVMYYHSGVTMKGEKLVEEMAFLSMEDLKACIRQMCRSMGANIGGREEDGVNIVAPSELREPKRARFAVEDFNPQMRGGEALLALLENTNDVADLADLEVFGEIPELPDSAPSPPWKKMYM